MEEERCFRCLKSGKVVRLLDAVYENEISKICEECALIENIPIIRKPSSFQLKESQRPYTVQERLARMSGVKGKISEPPRLRNLPMGEKLPVVTLDKLRKPKDYSQILKQREERTKRKNQPLELVDNYNWYMQRARRSRKISLAQLGAIIGESDVTLKMMEDGLLPDDADRIIRKTEQFFKINLRKNAQEQEQRRIEQVKMPARILSFNNESLKNLTISDLKKLKEQREKIEQEEADREIASKIIWRGKTKEEREKETKPTELTADDLEAVQNQEESPEEKKSRKSFWDIFKRKDKEDIEDVFVGTDISEIDKK